MAKFLALLMMECVFTAGIAEASCCADNGADMAVSTTANCAYSALADPERGAPEGHQHHQECLHCPACSGLFHVSQPLLSLNRPMALIKRTALNHGSPFASAQLACHTRPPIA